MRWLLFLGLMGTVLSGCGRGAESVSVPLAVQLAIPDGVSEREFWYGIEERELIWHGYDGSVTRMAISGQEAEQLTTAAGGRLEFAGSDADGNLLVHGEVGVDAWTPTVNLPKVVVIKLIRTE